MGAGATAAAKFAADAAEDIDMLSTTAVLEAQETLPFGSFHISCDFLPSTSMGSGTTAQFGISIEEPVRYIRKALLNAVDSPCS